MKTTQKRVLITGCSGSVGEALCSEFVQAGYVVFGQFRTTLPRKLRRLGQRFTSFQQDFTVGASLPRKDYDIVVNNAAINNSDVVAHEVLRENWDQALFLNLTVPFLILKDCLPHMIKNKWGRIINISSIYGFRASEENLPYTVSKHGLAGLTKTVAREYAKYGITANEICPGPIKSKMIERIATKNESATGQPKTDYVRDLCCEIPIGRMAEPGEIASFAVFLCSDSARYINGTSLPIDGGMTL